MAAAWRRIIDEPDAFLPDLFWQLSCDGDSLRWMGTMWPVFMDMTKKQAHRGRSYQPAVPFFGGG